MVTHLCNCDFHKSKFIKAKLEQSSRILKRNLGTLIFEIREISIVYLFFLASAPAFTAFKFLVHVCMMVATVGVSFHRN